MCEFLKAPVSRNTSPKILKPDAAISLWVIFKIIAFYRRYIWLLIKLKKLNLPAIKLGAKYCKLGGKVRRIVDFWVRQVGGGIFQFGR